MPRALRDSVGGIRRDMICFVIFRSTHFLTAELFRSEETSDTHSRF